MKRINLIFIHLLIGTLCYFSLSGSAISFNTKLGQCALGENCLLPAGDKLDVQFIIHPSNGTRFECIATAISKKLEFWIEGGMGFSVQNGKGYFVASPSTTIVITGVFSNPADLNQEGAITVHTLRGNGSVICYSL